MEIKIFIEQFAELFEETSMSDFLPETEFKYFNEWSSFTALSIIAMVDEKYNVKITGDDIRKTDTVNDLFEIIKSRI